MRLDRIDRSKRSIQMKSQKVNLINMFRATCTLSDLKEGSIETNPSTLTLKSLISRVYNQIGKVFHRAGCRNLLWTQSRVER